MGARMRRRCGARDLVQRHQGQRRLINGPVAVRCTAAQIQTLAITPVAYSRFESLSPGSVLAALQSASSLADTYLSSFSSSSPLADVAAGMGHDPCQCR